MSPTLAFLALLFELMLGYPDWLVRSIGHPVTWTGRLTDALDHKLNHEQDAPAWRRAKGAIAVVALIAVAGAVGFALQHNLPRLPFGLLVLAVLASTLLAQRSLHAHVAQVALALERDGLEAGRKAVARIVGRDPDALDETGVARAAIESLAENFSDGVVAPALWLAVAGLPGAAVYKAINTADSMIGHRRLRHADFGFAAARLDDLVNLPASRISALLIIAAAGLSSRTAAENAWQAVRRDAPQHRSPNAGYPEAAIAGALGLALAGPRRYDGILVEDATMGDGRRDAGVADIHAALALYHRADALLIALVGLVSVLVIATS
jgi:adenosylcobinamide-phosphate synthase